MHRQLWGRLKFANKAAVMERSKGRFAMKAVADTLVVARSNLIERVSRAAKPRGPYPKAGDKPLLALIRRLVDERPTYGYRRITRLVNRRQKTEGKPNINAKRVLRIMQANQLTLERHTGRRPGRTHDGIVIALRSNVCWCSDHFELAPQWRDHSRAVRDRRLRSGDYRLVGYDRGHLRRDGP